MEDSRNLIDEYKGMPNEQVFAALNTKRTPLEIAIENVEHQIRYIESFGSTRSVNVGVAAGIAMYEYTRQIIF